MSEENKKTFIITRGCPGSGKTFFIKEKYPEAKICSANDFFTDKNGVYDFIGSLVPDSHNYCFRLFQEALERGEKTIVLDNTNTKLWEFETYVKSAAENGYEVTVFRFEGNPEIAAMRNIHSVPVEQVIKFYERMEPYEGEEIIPQYEN